MSVRFAGKKQHLIIGLAGISLLGAASSIIHYSYFSTKQEQFSDTHGTSIPLLPGRHPPKAALSANVGALFSRTGKQDRADYISQQAAVTSSIGNDAKLQFVAASLTPVDMTRPGPTRAAGYFRQYVNRTGKSDQLSSPQMAVMKAPAKEVLAEEETGDVSGISAALFLVSPSVIASSQTDQAAKEKLPATASIAEAKPKTSTWADLVKLARVGSGDGEKKEPAIFGALSEDEFRAREFSCMATAIYFEARGESIKGQTAVAQVIMTRVRSDYYPNTICGVVYQGQWNRNACQFSFACDGHPDRPKNKEQWNTAIDVAKKVISGQVYLKEIGDATHYHATYVSPAWRKLVKRITRIGVHIFYKADFAQPLVASADFKNL